MSVEHGSTTAPESDRDAAHFLNGGHETGALMRALDWSATALGPEEEWPQSLRSAVRIVLTSRFAMWMAWGPDLTFMYNDSYARMTLGEKHPWALGKPARDVWPEIWTDIEPRIAQVMKEGISTWDEALLLFLERSGYTEETYHTFSYSPLSDERGAIAGMLCVVTEETVRVIGERQLALLRDLASELASTTRYEDVLSAIERGLSGDQRDLPFTLTYLFEEGGSRARLTCATGIEAGHVASPLRLENGGAWPMDEVWEKNELVVVEDLDKRFADLPKGAWTAPAHCAAIVPIAHSGQEQPAGFLIAGLNPYRRFDAAYGGFVQLVAGQIGSSLANARAYEEEKRRAEALAEIDRAKTTFFSNVSHEFRTPLTLMLGPLEDLIRDGISSDGGRDALRLVYRNGQRLLKLVNTLLEFSRIEAGRVRASYEPVDLATYTSDLASTFRAAVERVGLRLDIDTPSLAEPVYIDREMWEKIVLNLVSNAFKYTLEGGIDVSLRSEAGNAVLTVSDTGSGIPALELPKLFNRFHRVEGARGRTHEGTGIGLALVQELVRLHGGSVDAESDGSSGSTFTVRIPLGRDHLPSDRIVDKSALASPGIASQYVDEAMRWIPGASDHAGGDDETTAPLLRALDAAPSPARILLADDNADMRGYVRRLLSPVFEVTAVNDGVQALDAVAASKPDLILTDVMMPNLDGFALLRALRENPETSAIPVIMLSARAGEEARVDGLNAGADDYLVKPFAARELIARVSSTLALSRVRREAQEAIQRSEERYRSLVQASAAIVWTASAEGAFESEQLGWTAFTGNTFNEIKGRGWANAVHPEDRRAAIAALQQAALNGMSYEGEQRLRHRSGEYRNMSVRVVPITDGNGGIRELVGVHTDVTLERRLQQMLESERRGLRQIFERSPAFIATLRGPEHVFEIANEHYLQLIGGDRKIAGMRIADAIPEVKEQGFIDLLDSVYESGQPYVGREVSVNLVRGGALEERIVDFLYHPTREADGAVNGIFVHGVDVTEQARARRQVEQQAAELERTIALLQEQSALNETITANAISALLMLDQQGRPTFMNPTSMQVTGHSLDDFRGRSMHEVLHHLRPDGSAFPESECIVSMHLKRGEALQNHRDYFVRPDGTFYPVSVALAPVSGNVRQFVLEFRDITAEVEAEEALREANRRKDEFLATLSHELRTPLTAILGWARMLKIAADDPETVETAIDTIEQSARAQAQLIDDVLDLSRITSGKVRIQPAVIDVSEVAVAASDAVRLAAVAKGLTFRVDAVPTGPEATILGDPNRIQQVIWNLLTNAIKFTNEGGVVQMTVTSSDTNVAITVTDSGIGMRPDFLPHVFEPFRQAETSTTRVHGGLGLGLSIVRYLVELHGGSIAAESDGADRGSTFTVSLPRLRQAPALDDHLMTPRRQKERHPGEEMIDLSGVSILVIDDQQSIRDYMAAVLQRAHASVRTASSVSEAIRSFEAQRVSMVLCDIAMPHEDGFVFLNWMRAADERKRTPVIAITAFGRSSDEQQILSSGFNGYIRKPVEPERLTRAVRAAVDAAGEGE